MRSSIRSMAGAMAAANTARIEVIVPAPPSTSGRLQPLATSLMETFKRPVSGKADAHDQLLVD